MTVCRAVALVNNVTLPCVVEAPHPGIAHTDAEGQVVWCSDIDAIQASTPTTNQREYPRKPPTEAKRDAWQARHARRWER